VRDWYICARLVQLDRHIDDRCHGDSNGLSTNLQLLFRQSSNDGIARVSPAVVRVLYPIPYSTLPLDYVACLPDMCWYKDA